MNLESLISASQRAYNRYKTRCNEMYDCVNLAIFNHCQEQGIKMTKTARAKLVAAIIRDLSTKGFANV